MSDQIKINQEITRIDAEKLLERLTNILNETSVSELKTVDLAACSKLRFNLKLRENNALIKIRCAKGSEEDLELCDMDDVEEVKYKSLKKKMKKSFSSIGDYIEAGKMPPDDLVALFLDQSILMTSIPDYGDEFYAEYDNACQEFKKAFENSSLTDTIAAYNELKMIKKSCHKKYK